MSAYVTPMAPHLARSIRSSQHRALFDDNTRQIDEAAVDEAALKELFRVAYADLLVMARARLRKHGAARTRTELDTKTLVHEAYLRLSSSRRLRAKSRIDFLRYASLAMRSVIVDTLREQHAQRRGGGLHHEALSSRIELVSLSNTIDPDVHKLQVVLGRLASAEPRLREIVRMRFYAGLTDREIGNTLGLTDRTVRRDWERARRFLLEAFENS